MSEPVAKDRPNVDLDDFERRLRQRDHEHEDPLAELARLVGETSDPYDDVFARERGAPSAGTPREYDRLSHLRSGHDQRHRGHGEHDVRHPEGDYDPAAFGHDDDYRDQHGYSARAGAGPNLLAGDFAAIEAGLRGTMPAQADAYAADHEYYAQNERYPHDGYPQQDRSGMTAEAENWPAPVPQEPPRSRRSVYAMIATIALGVIGVGVAFAYKGSSSSPSEIRTIAAATGPTKIQPPADASADAGAANQDSAMLGKGNQQVSPTRLVDGVEQPVDLGQAVQENASRNADAGGATQGDASNVPVPPAPGQVAAAPADGQPAAVAPRSEQLPSFGLSEMPPPKKVKVVSVRPDGTILPSEAAPPIDAMTQAPPPAISPASSPKTPTTKIATTKTATPKGTTPKTTSRVSSKPPQTAAIDADATVPAPKPARKAKPKKVAALEAQPDATNSADQAAAPVSSGGGFAVQLAAPGSEAEAKSVTSRLAKKFADALDGRRLGVHKAQSNGKSVFRVRTSSLSREDAVGLCEKLKAAGGSCFVAKN